MTPEEHAIEATRYAVEDCLLTELMDEEKENLRLVILHHIRAAVAEEREECARIVEEGKNRLVTAIQGGLLLSEIAAAIRARGETSDA